MRILGIDPGLATTGFAVLDVEGHEKKLITVGVVNTPAKLPLGERLQEIYKDISSLLTEYKPKFCSIEQIFFSKNVTTGIQVSHARGVILLALYEHGIEVYEFSPSAMKLALTGNGRADKKSIQKMVKLELKLKEVPKPDDAADAVSLALTLAATLR
ncbi:MAG: crossover junction endodeoxyribonuclease RuvC [Candidatus Gracilibacteria bacterium]